MLLLFVLLCLCWHAHALQETCQDLVQQRQSDVKLLDSLKMAGEGKEASDDVHLKEYFDDCLDLLVRRNYFESVKYLLRHEFGNGSTFDKDSGKELSKAQSVVQSAMQYVRSQQD